LLKRPQVKNSNSVEYALEPELSAKEFRAILIASGLAERRPASDATRLDQMLRQADIIVTARVGTHLVGVSRAITDFSYCCYLSDLAVDAAYQRQGIGKRLIEETRRSAGTGANLVLLAAPAAQQYCPKIGMDRSDDCWVLPRTR
jgi:GNAT superfamily N-acetyltransferase